MMLSRIALTVLLATFAAWSAAQGTPGNGKKELVQRIVQAQQGAVEGIARGLAEQSIAQLAQQAMSILQTRVPPDQREAVAREIQADIKKYGDEVVPMIRERANKLAPTTIGTLLEEKFSEDELKQLVATMESPVFRKYQQLGPELQKAMVDKLVAETRPLVEPKLKALQDTVGKRLGLPPAGAPAAAPASTPRAAASAPKASASTPRK